MASIIHDHELREACRIIGVYTANRFNTWALAGPARASCRAHVMSVLMGRKMPQSKSGVTAIEAELHRRAGIEMSPDSCSASRQREFTNLCRAEFGLPECRAFLSALST